MRIDCPPAARARPSCGRGSTSPQRTHPMHLHGYHFRVVSVNGAAAAPGRSRAGRTRSRSIRSQTVVVRPYFDYFTGVYVFHCHAAEHGDMSMMGQMEVVGMIRRALLDRRRSPLAVARARRRERGGDARRSRPSTRRRSRPSGRRATCPRRSGDTIEWRLTQPGNPNAATHDIWLVAPGGQPQQLGASYLGPKATHRWSRQTGTYQFYCSIHGGLNPGGMNGTVVVTTTNPGPPVDPGTAVDRPRLGRPRRPDRRCPTRRSRRRSSKRATPPPRPST